MKPLAEPAIKAVKEGKINFHPKRWTKVYLDWMDNIRDWCISRQIWWGHRLPVYYCHDCESKGKGVSKGEGVIVSKIKPEKCPECGGTDIEQDPDVLDTWFSSWLWPFSTFGWPFTDTKYKKEELDYFYPTSCLVTAQEIIFFWVARMIMAGLEFCGDIPFKDVYIHGTVRDETGTKMSKSLGNTIDPIEIIQEYGTDALRFSLISITSQGQDVFLSKDRFESGRNFANKIWNVSRFLLMNLKDDAKKPLSDLKEKDLSLADRWILSSFYTTVDNVTKSLDSYKFNDAANSIYSFLWRKYCDWYVEISKASIDTDTTQIILYNILKMSLQLLHPIMPFITEEIWQTLDNKESIMVSAWPKVDKDLIDKEATGCMERIIAIIVSIRNIRASYNIAYKLKVDLLIDSDDKTLISLLDEIKTYANKLSNVDNITIKKNIESPKAAASAVLDFCQIYIPLEGKIDIKAEKTRLTKSLTETEKFINVISKKLSNNAFTQKAPKEIIEKEREREKVLSEKALRIKESIESLS